MLFTPFLRSKYLLSLCSFPSCSQVCGVHQGDKEGSCGCLPGPLLQSKDVELDSSTLCPAPQWLLCSQPPCAAPHSPCLPLAAPPHHPWQPLPAPGRALQTLWLYPAPCHVPLPASSPGTEIAGPLPKSTNSRGKMRWQSLLLMRVLGIVACNPLPSMEGDGAHPATSGYF